MYTIIYIQLWSSYYIYTIIIIITHLPSPSAPLQRHPPKAHIESWLLARKADSESWLLGLLYIIRIRDTYIYMCACVYFMACTYDVAESIVTHLPVPPAALRRHPRRADFNYCRGNGLWKNYTGVCMCRCVYVCMYKHINRCVYVWINT